MNAEAERLIEARREEVERLGGLGAYRLRALQNLKLKTVVKVRGTWTGSEGRAIAAIGPRPRRHAAHRRRRRRRCRRCCPRLLAACRRATARPCRRWR